jgi:hypothetical protein
MVHNDPVYSRRIYFLFDGLARIETKGKIEFEKIASQQTFISK